MKKAFTLVELLVVISIIALLMAILMPALSIAKRQAQGVACLANVSSLSKAWYAYALDNDGLIVGAHTHLASRPYHSWAVVQSQLAGQMPAEYA